MPVNSRHRFTAALCVLTLLSTIGHSAPIRFSSQLVESPQYSDWKQAQEWILYQKGSQALTKRSHQEAIDWFERSLESNPVFFPAHLGLADVAFQQGKTDIAEKHLANALEAAPNSAIVNTAWAKYLYMKEEHAKAEDSFQRAIELKPDFIEPKLELASLYLLRLDSPEKAQALYKEVSSLDATIMPAYYGLISSLIVQNKVDEAIASAASSLARFPNDAQLYELKSTAHTMQGDKSSAIRALEQAMIYAPGKFSILRNLADLYFGEKQYKEVIQTLKTLPIDLTDNVELNYKLALAYQIEKETYLAKVSYEKILNLEPNMAPSLNNLATLLLEDTKLYSPEKALELAKQANQVSPGNPSYLDTLGWAHFKNGNKKAARTDIERALQISPDLKEAQEHLKLINR